MSALTKTARLKLRRAMRKDFSQELVNGCTPDRGYPFAMDETVKVVEALTGEAPPQWTKRLPTKPGTYWFRVKRRTVERRVYWKHDIVHIALAEGRKPFLYASMPRWLPFPFGACAYDGLQPTSIKHCKGQGFEWAGPIARPEGVT